MPVKPLSQTGALVLQKEAKHAGTQVLASTTPTLFLGLKCLAPLVGKILPPAAREITQRSWSSRGLGRMHHFYLICFLSYPVGAVFCICTIFLWLHMGKPQTC